jgi:predicted alpha/beta superfamily hydrolase
VKRAVLIVVLIAARATPSSAQTRPDSVAGVTAPLVIGETFTVASRVMGEVRRINVYAPPIYTDSPGVRLPVLYMPDGGLREDFLHVAGLVQVSVGNGTMRPFLLVGIENTERRRDMTGPTGNAEDRKVAAHVGGSAEFRRFIRTELMPLVRQRYRTTDESAVVGESLAGLFVVETLLLEPDLFDTYVAIDPSLWWNDQYLLRIAPERLAARHAGPRTLFLASSGEPELARLTRDFAGLLEARQFPGLRWHYLPLPEEQHSTIYHPAALRAFRLVFAPAAAGR